MSAYFIAFISLNLFIFLSGIHVYLKHKSTSWFFYLIFSCLIPFWYILYFISFNDVFGAEKILQIYRFQYSLSLIALYSIVFFVLFYAVENKYLRRKVSYIYLFFFCIFLLSNFTPFIVQSVSYSEKLWSYIEDFWPLYSIFVFLYALIFPLFSYISYIKLRRLKNLERVRIIYVIIWFLVFCWLSLTFLVFIPFIFSDASLLLLEKLTPFFILPFIVSVLYAGHKYHFTDYRIYIHNLISYWWAWILTLFAVFLLKTLLWYLWSKVIYFWNMNYHYSLWDIILGIMIYVFFLSIFQKFQIENTLRTSLDICKEKLTYITNTRYLTEFLSSYFQKNFGVDRLFIEQNINKYPELSKYFLNPVYKDKFFLRDYVFLQKNKHKWDMFQILQELDNKAQIVFPIYNKKLELWYFIFIWNKNFWRSYSAQEFQELQRFSYFLESHLKYIEVYKKLQSISLELDKKVDEKTIEYNTLISKQKEFIRYLWHEIKNPLTNTLFLADDMKNRSWGEDEEILYDELLKISKLVNQVFSTEKFDLDKVQMVYTQIDVWDFFRKIISSFRRSYPNVVFEESISQKIWELNIDEIQFTQVIHNLLTNALKFSNKFSPRIVLQVYKKSSKIYIHIHDNGKGFAEYESKNLFEKYVSENSESWGLWLWLYLCKKIIEIHSGKIYAQNSSVLTWAELIIIL